MLSVRGFKPVAPLLLRVADYSAIGFQLGEYESFAYEDEVWESFGVAGYCGLPFAALVKTGAEVGDPPAVQVRVVNNQLLEVGFFHLALR
jgi:hypothetical protein